MATSKDNADSEPLNGPLLNESSTADKEQVAIKVADLDESYVAVEPSPERPVQKGLIIERQDPRAIEEGLQISYLSRDQDRDATGKFNASSSFISRALHGY